MSSDPQFKKAFPFQKDVLALPDTDLDAASRWHCAHFGMVEVERLEQPVPTVILERDGTRIGFSINGGDASQDGAAVLVANIQALKNELGETGQRSATGAGSATPDGAEADEGRERTRQWLERAVAAMNASRTRKVGSARSLNVEDPIFKGRLNGHTHGHAGLDRPG